MEPFKANKLPIQYNIDKELLSLISEANEKYGEYKSNLKSSKVESNKMIEMSLRTFIAKVLVFIISISFLEEDWGGDTQIKCSCFQCGIFDIFWSIEQTKTN